MFEHIPWWRIVILYECTIVLYILQTPDTSEFRVQSSEDILLQYSTVQHSTVQYNVSPNLSTMCVYEMEYLVLEISLASFLRSEAKLDYRSQSALSDTY